MARALPATARRRFERSRPLLFTHIPKCAGTALRGSLTDALSPRRIAMGFDRCLYGDFDDFDRLPAPRRAELYLPGDDWRRDAVVIVVHMAPATTRQLWPAAQTMTVLREPRTRLLSLFFYWRAVPAAELTELVGWGERVGLARRPLDQFLDAPAIACHTDNVVTRMLLWPHPAIPVAGFIDPQHDARLLAEARAALSRFDYADAIDRPGLHARLGRWIGRRLREWQDNVSAGWLPFDLHAALTPALRGRLDWLTRLDRELWADVCGEGAGSLATAAWAEGIRRFERGGKK